jgi:hypothetical protein
MPALWGEAPPASAVQSLQAGEQALFEEAKATTEQELGDTYAAEHDAGLSTPLDEALLR